jgi:histidinol-phosphate aminotransferase
MRRPVEDGPEYDLRHHGDAEVGDGLVDLAVNVRAGTPPSWLAERIAASLAGLAAYPDGTAARRAVAARHGRPASGVLLTAGAAEAFVLLARVLRPHHAVVVHPQFTEPEAALRAAGHAVDRVLLDAADGFRLDPARVPDDADLVVLGNPTNPTSVLHPAALVRRLARPGRTLVVDEAFMDAVPGERESLAGGPAGGDVPGLVVLRSLTKTWGLAGLRVGYLLAGADLVAALRDAQPLWAVSTPALVAAEACMAPEALAEAAEAARTVTADRAYLMERLRAVPEVRVAGDTPVGPFLLLHVPGAADVRSRLRESGYAVRRADTFPGLGPDWLRVAVRDRRTTDGFANALAMATVALPGLPAPASPAGGPGSPSGPAAPPGPAASPTSPDVPRTPEPADSPGDPRSPGAAHSPGRPSARPRPPVLPG